jgi:hypothetical protein
MRTSTGTAATALAIAVLTPALMSADAVGATTAWDTAGVADAHHRVILGAVGNSPAETIERERETGRPIQGVRAFKRWNEPLIGSDQVWAKRTGHTSFLSVKSRLLDGSPLPWKHIAKPPPGSSLDADLRRQAKELKGFRDTVYLIFNHEPDAKTSRPMGTPAEFVAAWRRLVSTHRKAGVTNVRYVWTMTDQAFRQGYAHAYYPGDRYVDGIAVDAYNWYDCTGGGRWTSMGELIEPHRRFGLRHPGKELMVLEWGSVEDPARTGRKAQWIRDATALFARPEYRAYRAVAHWDDRHSGSAPGGGRCEFDYRTSPSALNAWRAMAADPTFRPAPATAAMPRRQTPLAVVGLTVLLGSGVLAGLLWASRRPARRDEPAGPPPPVA